jgi:hypothetical protein
LAGPDTGRTVAGGIDTTLPRKEQPVSIATFPQFEAAARAKGYDEVTERRWEPMVTIDTHQHPFSVRAVLAQGEMWLTAPAAVSRH